MTENRVMDWEYCHPGVSPKVRKGQWDAEGQTSHSGGRGWKKARRGGCRKPGNLRSTWDNMAPALENSAMPLYWDLQELCLQSHLGNLIDHLLKTLQGKTNKQPNPTQTIKLPPKPCIVRIVYTPFSGSQVPFWLFPNSSHAARSHLSTRSATLPSFRPYTLRGSPCRQ